jgi:hypothetical protein
MPDVIDRTKTPLAVSGAECEATLGGRQAAPPATTEWVRLNFAVQRQLQDQWCWAAVSASIARHYGAAKWTQCAVVNEELEQTDCCHNGATPDCNQPWYLDRALRRVGALKKVESGRPRDLKKVRREIDANRPVCVRIGWGGGGGHFITVEGYRGDGGLVAVEDPWYGTSDVSVGLLEGGYQGSGRWTHTYYTRSP